MYSKVFKLYLFFIAVAILAVFKGATASAAEKDNMPFKESPSHSHTLEYGSCSDHKFECENVHKRYNKCPDHCKRCDYCHYEGNKLKK
ncbi:hypothetical protein PPACK8108_LOCUS6233 [Phakopsora pachyrhizi]|uniref:Uncharacterized protein n=1 Tax=Phakopsora pachyrhizi TaxID=170000 RepID=A0AAV0ATB8_PHAPC|nr:hypothetical protein PPACK8108_LOCUS6233 [Phakopsora pachyrhizi]